MTHIKEITAPGEKSQICSDILRALPNWFGIEESIVEYVNGVQDKPFYCAFDGDRPVGFVSLLVHNSHTAEIYVMGVLESYHRHGLGRKLVATCENYCAAHRMSFLTVKTLAASHPDEGYKRTRLFYEAMGFTPLQVFPLLWDESNPCLFLAKHIGGAS
ncbi:MAG: GNAT family N-acetyltransferase [Defluviitaleaceae bacterium]|nr:GNAT family N-acetyltransferase [Defluviitaleaceae bacterium]